MLTRNEKIAAATIIILTLIISVYLIVTAYQEIEYFNEFYNNPWLTRKDPDYRLYFEFLRLRKSLPRYGSTEWRVLSSLGMYSGLILFNNGTINKTIDEKLSFIHRYKINDTRRIVQRINEFFSTIGLYTNYTYAAIELTGVKIKTPKESLIIDYIIKCRIAYTKETSDGEKYYHIYLHISARTGAITYIYLMLDSEPDMDTLRKIGVVKDLEKLSYFADINMWNSSSRIPYLLHLMGFNDEYYLLDGLSFKPKPVNSVLGKATKYVGYFHGVEIPIMFVTLSYRVLDLYKHISIYALIIPGKTIKIEYHEPQILNDEVREIAIKYMQEKMGIPKSLINISGISQIFHLKNEHILTNYFIVNTRIHTRSNLFLITLYIDPINGEVHDFSIKILW